MGNGLCGVKSFAGVFTPFLSEGAALVLALTGTTGTTAPAVGIRSALFFRGELQAALLTLALLIALASQRGDRVFSRPSAVLADDRHG